MLTQRQTDLFAADHSGRLDDVSPRHLAGPGDPRHVTHALAAAGWALRSDALSPVIHLVSPDGLHQLRYGPTLTSMTWRLDGTHADGHWYASFTSVPAEILTGFTDGLLIAAPAESPPPVWDVLTGAGWTHTRSTTGNEARSPDGAIHLSHQPITGKEDPYFGWQITVSTERDHGPPLWTAWIAHFPPPHLVHGLVTALTDPAPVQRNWHEPEGHYRARRTESPVTPKQYARAHRDRIDTARAHVRAATRTLTATPPSPAPAPVRQAR
ncbi:DUF317 domain-containing protein [Streptomyces sp. NPDC020875]|uniref:DUF317 domain-containing protein n=1 Tax=Streptomyces sp. NPDC020875 TaxID=3154898 RepID=UPI00340EC1EE